MKKENMQVIKTRKIAFDTIEMVLENEYISQKSAPGQFLHISVSGHTLRRPISIADVNERLGTVTIIFKKIGAGTKKLASYQPGTIVHVLGPNGNGFIVDNKVGSTVLLVGGGVGVPPLHYLGKTLAEQNINIISILGFQSSNLVFYKEEFKRFSQTYIVTDDGSAGEKGYVTNKLDQIDPFDLYYSCGPVPMLQAVTKKLAHKSGFISLEEHMGCGVGACYACVVRTKDGEGYQKVCQDGPVFAAQEVKL